MTAKEKQAALEKLTEQLVQMKKVYDNCVARDEKFEVKKQLRVEIRGLLQQIQQLQEEKIDPPPDF